MDAKQLTRVEIKDAAKGQVSAVFATFNVIDSDGDVTIPGAFEDGAEVAISSYGHTTWGGALPVGKGVIRTTKTEAILDGQFFMDVPEARSTFLVVKNMGARQQWSYGYDVLDAEPGTWDGQDVRLLKRQMVHEVSPVLVGAGVNTRTLSAKSAAGKAAGRTGLVSEYKAAIRPHETPVTVKAWDPQSAAAAVPVDATVDQLRSAYAWCDPNGDPALKSSYGFLHHDAPGGAANLRACLIGIAKLNGAAGGTDLPESDRRGVYNHLASHLVDGDRDVPDLRDGAGGALKFGEEAAAVLAGLNGLITRTSEVMALRRSKGKALASSSVDLLNWVYDDLRRLRVLLDSPQDDAAREYARYVHSLLNHSGD